VRRRHSVLTRPRRRGSRRATGCRGPAHRADGVVIVYGAPVVQPGKINSMRLHEIAGRFVLTPPLR
jgi:hypothetical protein